MVKAAQINELSPGQGKVVEVESQSIALFNVEGTHGEVVQALELVLLKSQNFVHRIVKVYLTRPHFAVLVAFENAVLAVNPRPLCVEYEFGLSSP